MCVDARSLSMGCYRTLVLGLLLITAGCNSTSGWVMNRSGMKQYQRGNFAQARYNFARAIADNPHNADYRHNLAMSLQKQGDAGAAETILRHNLTLNAMHQPTYHSLAQILSTGGRTSEAQELLAGWEATQPYVPESHLEMAWLQREMGNTAGAEEALQSALKADPTHPTALAHLGQLYQQTGRSDLAVAYYQRSLTSKWDQPEVQSRLTTLTEPNSLSRSAMMQNPAGGSLMTSVPQMNSGPAMADGTPYNMIALEDLNSNPQPRRLRRLRRGDENGSMMAAYPLPNFDAPTTAWMPAGTIPGQSNIAFQAPEIGNETVFAPQIVGTGVSSSPMMASGPPMLPQTDPAHAMDSSTVEMTASVPVVDPH